MIRDPDMTNFMKGNPGGEELWERSSQSYEGYRRKDMSVVPPLELVMSVCNAWSCRANVCARGGKDENKTEILRMEGQTKQILRMEGQMVGKKT